MVRVLAVRSAARRAPRARRPGLAWLVGVTVVVVAAACAVGGSQLAGWAWLRAHREAYDRLAAGVRDGTRRPIPWPGGASWHQVDGARARRIVRDDGVFVEVRPPWFATFEGRYTLVHAPLGHVPRERGWEKLGGGWFLVELPRDR